MRKIVFGLGVVFTVAIVATSALAQSEERTEASAVLRNAAGDEIGEVVFTAHGGKMLVRAQASGLSPGFHGFHVHAVGTCAGDFTSAGGHLNPSGQSHDGHAGDMPSLMAHEDGTAELSFLSDRVTMADLFDADGSAVIVHAGPDNYGNIPVRYAPEPDAATLGTGDSGARFACGVIQ